MKTPHSPLTWATQDNVTAGGMVHFAIVAPLGGSEWMVASLSPMGKKRAIDVVNGEIICKAVNNHETMLVTLAALVSTAIRHRWQVNSDEPNTIKAALDLLAALAEK